MREKEKKYDDPEKIELRSEEVQEILGRPPKWIIRWGITIIFMVIAGLFTGSYFFKYPDMVQASITVTTENLPAGVMTKTTGRIDSLFVSEKQMVERNNILALIENPASFNDVIKLKETLEIFYINNSLNYIFPKNLLLGDIQQTYFSFLKSLEDYQYFINADYCNKKIQGIKKQVAAQNKILTKTKSLLNISTEQLMAAKQLFIMDSTLYGKKALSPAEYENAKNTYFQQQQSYENTRLSIDNQQLSILQLEQSIFDLEQQHEEQKNQLLVSLSGAFDQLNAQIKQWEQAYLLTSPIEGKVTMTKYWQKNQNVNAGEILMTVVPTEETEIIGRIFLPPQGAGKVKEGQMVNVKFDNFPYMEFGMVRVQIKNIALVPVIEGENKGYVLEVDFPENLKTNYGKELTFTQEMSGTAEIITDDLRLLDRFINPIRAIILASFIGKKPLPEANKPTTKSIYKPKAQGKA